MVGRDDNWAAGDVDSDGEVEIGQALDLGDDVVVEFTADVIVKRYSDGNLGVWKQLALVRRENYREALVVRKIVSLLLL